MLKRYATQLLINPTNTHIDLLDLLFQPPHYVILESAKTATPAAKTTSEIRRLEYDRHSYSASGDSFHSDHPNLCIGMVQIIPGELPEIFCSCLPVGGGAGRG